MYLSLRNNFASSLQNITWLGGNLKFEIGETVLGSTYVHQHIICVASIKIVIT